MKVQKALRLRRILALISAILIFASTLAVPTFAAIPAAQQKFWSVFDYNNVYKNMGVETFKAHWNKGRDTMPLMIHFGTQRVGYSEMHIPAFFDEMLEYEMGYDEYYYDVPIALKKGTYIEGSYMGHGNGFIYVGDGLDVPTEYCYMGHLYQKNTLYISNTLISLTVELIFVEGPLQNWEYFDITSFDYTNLFDTEKVRFRNYEVLKTVYRWDRVGDMDYSFRDIYNFSYRSRINDNLSAWKVLSDGDYYGFMFGQTQGAIWNEHMDGSLETIFYSWFNGPFGIDEDTDGMNGRRFGMISPLFYKEGYDTFYTPIFDDGFGEGYNTGYENGESSGYVNGYEYGYDEGYDEGVDYGKQNGYQLGYDDGEAYGWANGFGAGQDDMAKTSSTFKDMVFSIFDAPVKLIDGMLNFEIFGINLAGFVKTLVTLAVVALIAFGIFKLIK